MFFKRSLFIITLILFISGILGSVQASESFIDLDINGKNFRIVKNDAWWNDSFVRGEAHKGNKFKRVHIDSKLYLPVHGKTNKADLAVSVRIHLPKPAGRYVEVDKVFGAGNHWEKAQIIINLGKMAFGFEANATNGNTMVKKATDQGEFIVTYTLTGNRVEGTFSATLHQYKLSEKYGSPPTVVKRDAYIIKNGKFSINLD